MTRRLVARANLLALLAIGALLALVGGLTWLQFDATREARRQVRHTYEVLTRIADLGTSLHQAEAGQRGFLLTHDEAFLTVYREALQRSATLRGELRGMTADNPVQQQRLLRLDAQVQQRESLLEALLQRASGANPPLAASLPSADFALDLMAGLRRELASIEAEEDGLLLQRLAQASNDDNLTRWAALAGALAAALLLLLALRMQHSARQTLLASEATQRDLAEQLQGSLDSISQGLAVFDAAARLRRCNARLPEVLALPPRLTLPGTDYADLAAALALRADGQPVLESPAQLRHDQAQGRHTGAVVYERALDEGARHIEFRRTRMPEGGFILTATEVTERHRAEATRRNAQRLQAVGQLTGGIAHDFNNLLAVVLGNLELVKPKLGPDHPMLPRIERAVWGARRGAALTQQLLAFARRQPLAPQPVDLSAMLPDMATLLRRTLGEHIEVRVVDAAGLWPAMTDRTQVESALLNLALNARDAMPGGGRLTIELANKVLDADYASRHEEVSPGDYVMLAVSDTGHGMAPDVLARVFEPFFTTKPEGKGTGLGLSMVYGFAKQSGGHLKLYSEVGEGTTVRLYLPRALRQAAEPGERAPTELPTGTAGVLLLEDDAAVREVTAAMLRDLGYTVHEAGTGEEALALLRADGPDITLLLADVVLPGGMKGDAVAREARKLCPGLRVLFMSGYTENAIVHHGRLDDGVQLIGKPFQRDQLARKVATVLAA